MNRTILRIIWDTHVKYVLPGSVNVSHYEDWDSCRSLKTGLWGTSWKRAVLFQSIDVVGFNSVHCMSDWQTWKWGAREAGRKKKGRRRRNFLRTPSLAYWFCRPLHQILRSFGEWVSIITLHIGVYFFGILRTCLLICLCEMDPVQV